MDKLVIIETNFLNESLNPGIDRNDVPSDLGIIRIFDSAKMNEF